MKLLTKHYPEHLESNVFFISWANLLRQIVAWQFFKQPVIRHLLVLMMSGSTQGHQKSNSCKRGTRTKTHLNSYPTVRLCWYPCAAFPLTLSVCLWREPGWWRSWTEERAGPAGSLCWCRGWPSVSAAAGAGLPAHAVRCSTASGGKQWKKKNLISMYN